MSLSSDLGNGFISQINNQSSVSLTKITLTTTFNFTVFAESGLAVGSMKNVSSLTMLNCTFTVTMGLGSQAYAGNSSAGGVVGHSIGAGTNFITVTNCAFTLTVNSTTYFGNAIGIISVTTNLSFSNVTFSPSFKCVYSNTTAYNKIVWTTVTGCT